MPGELSDIEILITYDSNALKQLAVTSGIARPIDTPKIGASKIFSEEFKKKLGRCVDRGSGALFDSVTVKISPHDGISQGDGTDQPVFIIQVTALNEPKNHRYSLANLEKSKVYTLTQLFEHNMNIWLRELKLPSLKYVIAINVDGDKWNRHVVETPGLGQER